MRVPEQVVPRPAARMLARGCMWLLLAASICWLTTTSAAQAPSKKVKEEVEEPPKKASSKAPKPEEEDPVKPAKTPAPLRVDDDEPTAGAKRGKSAAPLLSDLLRDAANEPDDIRDLYRAIETPYDIAGLREGAGTRAIRIQPFPARINERATYMGTTPLKTLPEGDQKGIDMPFERRAIRTIDPFELWAVSRVKKFAADHKDSVERLQAAERALAAVLGFHESAKNTARREGAGWDDVANQIRTQLRLVQEMQLQYHSAKNDWDQAYRMAVQLAEAHPKLHKELIKPMERFVRPLLKEEDKLAEAQKRMAALSDIFPTNSLSTEVSAALAKKANELLAQAQNKKNEGNKPEAIKLLERARQMAPRHSNIENMFRQLNDDFPILNVGIARLPQRFVPGQAWTYPELLTLDLLYESLVKPVYNKQIGQRYFPVLAADQPKLTPLGREFELVRNAYWSDGKPVRAGDVRSTLERLLRDERGGSSDGRDDELQPLKEVYVGDDSFHVGISLKRGFLDPLALMSFKILPDPGQHGGQSGPIGSGPFTLKGKSGKDQVVFEANGQYNRVARPGLPQIREIRFFVPEKPVADFAKPTGRLHVLLDIPSQDFRNYETSLRGVHLFTLTPRRVYFLAVNHRKPELQSANVRRAMGLAIKRDEILTQVFRPKDEKVGRKLHRPLNGPFPPDSWAYNREASRSEDPSNPDAAMVVRRKANDALVRASGLTLKYPNDDPRVKRACEDIAKQVQNTVGVRLTLQGLDPHRLRQDVEEDHKYDLAYYHLDYPNQAYYLWPLFNPRAIGPGGSNYLGYDNDSDLERKFHNALEHREVSRVQEFMRDIHKQIFDKMPLIPLWQLDMHFAVHYEVETWPTPPESLDPLKLFSDIERWKLGRR